MGIGISSKGSFKNYETFARKVTGGGIYSALDSLAKEGQAALEQATPKDSTESASAWRYKIVNAKRTLSIEWYNDSVTNDGTPIVILLQYGHGTGTGGWVQGRDFINPALKPVFDKIADKVWKAVTSA